MDVYLDALKRVAKAARRFLEAHIATGKPSDPEVRREMTDLADEVDNLRQVENELDQPDSN